MSLSLQCLSRAARQQGQQQLLAASPTMLGAAVSRTPGSSPLAPSLASRSPFGHLGGLTPKEVTVSGNPASLLGQARAAAAAQQELAAAARPCAEAALQHFLHRRGLRGCSATENRASETSAGAVGPVLLGRQHLQVPARASTTPAPQLPVLLGRTRTHMALARPEDAPAACDAMQAARHARDAYLTRQQQRASRGVGMRVP